MRHIAPHLLAKNICVSHQPLTAIAWAPDGRHLAVANYQGMIELWDLIAGRRRYVYSRHDAVVSALSWSPDSRHLASASWDGTVQIWATDRGRLDYLVRLHERNSPSARVTAVSWSPNGEQIASAGTDWTIQVWNAEQGQHLCQLSDHLGSIQSLSWSPDSCFLLSGGEDGVVRVWDPRHSPRPLLTRSLQAPIADLAWHPSNPSIACVDENGRTSLFVFTSPLRSLWTMEAFQEREGEGDVGRQGSVAFSADGRVLASAGHDGAVTLRSPVTGALRGFLTVPDAVESLSFAPFWHAERTYLATGAGDGHMAIWEVALPNAA